MTTTIAINKIIKNENEKIKILEEYIIKNQEIYKNDDLNYLLIEPKLNEYKKHQNVINEWNKKLENHLIDFYENYKILNETVKKHLETNGITIDSLIKTLLEFIVKDVLISKNSITDFQKINHQKNENFDSNVNLYKPLDSFTKNSNNNIKNIFE
jgi:hypothetical protein